MKVEWRFKTADELIEFFKEFVESPDETLDISYFKVKAILRNDNCSRDMTEEELVQFYEQQDQSNWTLKKQ